MYTSNSHVYVFICTYLYAHTKWIVHVHTYTPTLVHACMCTYMCTECEYTRMHMYTIWCMHVCSHVNTCVHVSTCVHVHMYVCIHICMHLHIFPERSGPSSGPLRPLLSLIWLSMMMIWLLLLFWSLSLFLSFFLSLIRCGFVSCSFPIALHRSQPLVATTPNGVSHWSLITFCALSLFRSRNLWTPSTPPPPPHAPTPTNQPLSLPSSSHPLCILLFLCHVFLNQSYPWSVVIRKSSSALFLSLFLALLAPPLPHCPLSPCATTLSTTLPS